MKKILGTLIIATMVLGIYSCTNVTGNTEGNQQLFESANEMVEAAKANITEITSEDLNNLFDSEEMFVMIDVRLENEFNKGYIPGAVLMPRGVLEFRINSEKAWDDQGMYAPLKDEAIIIYCKKGSRGALAAQTLKQLGYTNVKNLTGGFKAWKAAFPENIEMIEVADIEIGHASAAEEDSGGC